MDIATTTQVAHATVEAVNYIKVFAQITLATVAIAQGWAVSKALEGTARNPEASGKVMVTMILGLAIIESIAMIAAFAVNG